MHSDLSHVVERRTDAIRRLRPEVMDVERITRLGTRPCVTSDCGGGCCSGGAGLIEEEATLLSMLAETHRVRLRILGVEKAGVESGDRGHRTTVVAAGLRSGCSWQVPDGRCSLHVLAVEDGLDWWTYKPLPCVLFPLRVRSRGPLRVLTTDGRAEQPDAPQCARIAAGVPPGAGLSAEYAFVESVWGLQPARLPAALEEWPIPDLDWHGSLDVNEKHQMRVVIGAEGSREVLKRGRDRGAAASLEHEAGMLARVSGRWFPRLVGIRRGEDGDPTVQMELLGGTLPLSVWLRSRPSIMAITEVARDILEACVAMERQGVFHLDLAPRNVLIEPATLRAYVVDFESVVDSSSLPWCNGGEFGCAAPEQYLNMLGRHGHLTESFFVGALMWRSVAAGSGLGRTALPDVSKHMADVPPALLGPMLRLMGDPAQGFAPWTRSSAAQVLADWSGEPTFPTPPRPVDVCGTEEDDQALKDRWIEGPGALRLHAFRRGLVLWDGGRSVAARAGLVDVGALHRDWTGDTYVIGPFRIDRTGIHIVEV